MEICSWRMRGDAWLVTETRSDQSDDGFAFRMSFIERDSATAYGKVRQTKMFY
jgi:hypothetical protein